MEISEIFDEAIRLSKYSKSKVKRQFWAAVHKLEKLLADKAIVLEPEKRDQLNAAKKKFL